MGERATEGVSSVHERQLEMLVESNLTMRGMERSLEDADMIMSFVNQGECGLLRGLKRS